MNTSKQISANDPSAQNEARIANTPKAGIQAKITAITPDLAARLLNGVNIQNYLGPQVDEYAAAMLSRKWVYNAQPIILSDIGSILDGHKRLIACAKSGASFNALLIEGVSADTLHTAGQHRRRSFASILEGRGVKSAGAVVRTLNKVIKLEQGTFGKPTPPVSWSTMERALEANPQLHELIAESENMANHQIHASARNVMIFAASGSGKTNMALTFLRSMLAPTLLESGSPARILATQLDNRRNAGAGQLDVDTQIALSFMAFNDHIKGLKRLRPYSWAPDYGTAKLGEDGLPISRKEFIENTPLNLGLEMPEGYRPMIPAESQIKTPAHNQGISLEEEISDKADVRMIVVTPAMADEWLSRFNTAGRGVRRSQLEALARDMRDGNWMMNVTPITFAGNPWSGEAKLLNGQHRLMAVSLSGVSTEFYVATGVREDASHSFDTQNRTHGEIKVPFGDERVLRAAAKHQWLVDNGYQPTDRVVPSALELKNTIEEHPSMLAAFRIARKREMQGIASAGVLTFFFHHISYQNREIAEVFINQLGWGVDLAFDNPVAKLRRNLSMRRGEISRRDVLQMLLDTWDEFAEQVEIKGVEELMLGHVHQVSLA